MHHNSAGKYRQLTYHIANWWQYFLGKWGLVKGTLTYRLRRQGGTIQVPPALTSVFKDIFMKDGYGQQFLQSQLPTAPVVIDVGANIGLFASYLKYLLPQAQIHCFEPLPANLPLLQANAASANPTPPSIAVHQAAITGRPQPSVTFYTQPGQAYSDSATTVPGLFNNHHALTVAATTLPAFMQQQGISVVHLLKMDAEGSEYDILYQLPHTLWPAIKHMIIETHDIDEQQQNLHSLLPYLEAQGMQCHFKHAVSPGLNVLWLSNKNTNSLP